MRIAVVGPTHPYKGGIAAHTTVLAQHLAAAGHEVELVSWSRQYPQRLYPGQQTVDEAEFAPFPRVRAALAWNNPIGWWRTGRSLRGLDAVVIAHVNPIQVPPYRLLIAALGRRGRRRPTVVVVCHNVLPHESGRFDRSLVGSLLRSANRLVAHSPVEGTLARELAPGVPVRVARMAPHLSAALVPVSGDVTATPRNRLLFFGLIRPYKGLDVLLRALAAVPEPRPELTVAGEFWGGTAPVQELVAELGLAEAVHLRPGYVRASDVPGLFADADALVLPYRSATGSQGVWFAFALGTPVIASDIGSVADDVLHGVDGFVVPPGDVAALTAAIERFYVAGTPERMRAAVRPVEPGPYWDRYLQVLLDGSPEVRA